MKKSMFRRWWFWVIVAIALICSLASAGGEDDDPTESSTPTTNTAAPTPEPAPEAVLDPAPTEEPLTFELIAGEAGEYGVLFTMNKGTEFEETYYIYRLPAGTYTVTNTGEYMSQLSVYSTEIVVNSSGWEEPAETFYSGVLDIGCSDTVTIADGSFVEIHEPAVFSFELNK